MVVLHVLPHWRWTNYGNNPPHYDGCRYCATPYEVCTAFKGRFVTMLTIHFQRSRSTAFFYRSCADLLAEFLVPPIASALMSRNLWTPLLCATALQGITVLLVLIAIPETLSVAKLEETRDSLDIHSPDTSHVNPAAGLSKQHFWRSKTKFLRASFDFIARDTSVALLVFTFLIARVGRQASNILFQYVSKRFGWTLAQVGALKRFAHMQCGF